MTPPRPCGLLFHTETCVIRHTIPKASREPPKLICSMDAYLVESFWYVREKVTGRDAKVFAAFAYLMFSKVRYLKVGDRSPRYVRYGSDLLLLLDRLIRSDNALSDFIIAVIARLTRDTNSRVGILSRGRLCRRARATKPAATWKTQPRFSVEDLEKLNKLPHLHD